MSKMELYTALRQLLFPSGIAMFKIEGCSMEPSIKHGQIIHAQCISGKLKKGKNYIFCRGKHLILHRFVCYEQNNAVFIGDASVEIEKIPIDSVIGEIRPTTSNLITCLVKFINLLYYFTKGHKFIFIRKTRQLIINFLLRSCYNERKI